jgi:hypothetical protein
LPPSITNVNAKDACVFLPFFHPPPLYTTSLPSS